jgi:ribosomal protein S28E/S33
MDGTVNNVIGPVRTMVGDTLILTGTIREYLIYDTISIILE